MYTTRTTDTCQHCGESSTACTIRPLTGEQGRCCASCTPATHDVRVERTIIGEPDPPPVGVPAAGPPLSRAEEDAVVDRLLAAADDPVEQHGNVAVSAYRSLAESRGLPLEHIIRAACRQQLAAVVQRPAATAPQNTPSTEEIDHA